MEEGSLYPALQRLELNGWIEGEWGLSANNRRARFYKLTADGPQATGFRNGAVSPDDWRDRARHGDGVMLRRWQRRLRYWLHSGERARLLREEMEVHLEMKAQELMEDGMTEADARGAARRQFGNATLQQEEARGTWIARWLSDLGAGLRPSPCEPSASSRASPRSPVLSAALGIGACSLIFGIANFALFRPLPVDDPSRLVSVSGKNLRRGRVGSSLAYPDFEDLRQARSFQGMTAFFQFMPATISSNGEPQRYWGSLVTANYFDVVRPAFAVGRGFDAAKDDRKGEAPVVVLSYRLWRSRFGRRSAPSSGESIELNRRKVTVVGRHGPGFSGHGGDVLLGLLAALLDAGQPGARWAWAATACRIAAVNG